MEPCKSQHDSQDELLGLVIPDQDPRIQIGVLEGLIVQPVFGKQRRPTCTTAACRAEISRPEPSALASERLR